MNYQKGFVSIALAVLVFALAVAGTYFTLTQSVPSYLIVNPNDKPPQACSEEAMQCPDGSYVGRTGPDCQFVCPSPAPVFCTQDAKQCADGSYVSRTGPKCEFTACPTPSQKQIFLTEGQRHASLLVQKIYPTYITGLNFREYPVASGQGEATVLYLGDTASNGCTVTLTLIKIEGKTAVFAEKTDNNKVCPICLAEGTLIDTPDGQIPVQDLKTGMAIWTIDVTGARVVGTIIKTSKTPVPATHQMTHIILADGREIFASPGHPIGDGRIFNDLSVGDTLDGNQVIISEKVSYDKGYTYDILPSGSTGFYFANGILIDSTLH